MRLPNYKLTPYQLRIAKMLIVEGLTTKEAAEKYNLHWDSVRNISITLLRKTESIRLAQAAYRLTQAGVLDDICAGDLKRFKRIKQTVYIEIK